MAFLRNVRGKLGKVREFEFGQRKIGGFLQKSGEIFNFGKRLIKYVRRFISLNNVLEEKRKNLM